MSAHRTLNDLYRAFDAVGPGRLEDPGDAGTITVAMWGQVCSVVTTGANETRTLAQPTKPGISASVVLDTDGGDFTLTVTGGYNADADTSIVFRNAGEVVVFYSVKVGTSYLWRIIKQEGANASAMWAGAPSPSDPNYHAKANDFFDDFHTYDGTATVGNWLLASAGGAGGTVALVNTVAGGQIVITCAGTDDDDGNQISQVSAPFYLAAGKHLWFEIRFKVKSTAAGNGLTQSDYYFGLASLNEDLTAVADNFAADGVLFTKVDGDAGTFDLTASMGGTNTGTSASMATVVEDTWMTLGFYVNGVTSITPYVDGVVGTAITATLPTDTSQGVIIGCRNGDATETITITVDYVKVVQLR